MTFDELQNASDDYLRQYATRRFDEYSTSRNESRIELLWEAQFFMRELEHRQIERDRVLVEQDRKKEDQQHRTDRRLELVVIVLILAELIAAIAGIVITVRDGTEQGILLESTAATLSALQATTETMNAAIQHQVGFLSEVSVNIYYYDKELILTNTGKKELLIVGYQFDGRRGPKMHPPLALPAGESYKVSADELVEELGHIAKTTDSNSLEIPFRVSLERQGVAPYTAECTLYIGYAGKTIKVRYGPTSLRRDVWFGSRKQGH